MDSVVRGVAESDTTERLSLSSKILSLQYVINTKILQYFDIIFLL